MLRSWRKTMLFGRIGGMLVDVAECCVMYLCLDCVCIMIIVTVGNVVNYDNDYCWSCH